ncbi:MAG: hypothetical protein MUC81_04990 [Bacteroidia bacterium]|nr:hypothetical protein [Bacteroidia bacterium]
MAHQVVSRWGGEKGIILLEHFSIRLPPSIGYAAITRSGFSIQLLLGAGCAAITRSGFSIRLPNAQDF